jgi:hypothetical protein
MARFRIFGEHLADYICQTFGQFRPDLADGSRVFRSVPQEFLRNSAVREWRVPRE